MNKAILVDVSAVMYRFHYKLSNMSNSKGEPTGAIYGLVTTLLNLMDRLNPTHMALCMDVKKSSLLRKEVSSTYKSNRSSAPEELVSQLKRVTKVMEAFNIFCHSKEGYEADDLINTWSEKLSKEGADVYILTGDKDLMQLVNDKVKILNFSKGTEPFKTISNADEVKEALGVYPHQVKDLFSIQGDSSDNIPGVKGIGPKGAIKLIEEYGDLETIYENIDKIAGTAKEKLLESKENAFMSKKLATLHSIPLEEEIEELKIKEFNKGPLFEVLTDLEFNSIIKRLKLEGNLPSLKIEHNHIENMEKINFNEDIAIAVGEGCFAISTSQNNYLIDGKIENFNIAGNIISFDVKKILKIKNLSPSRFFDVKIAQHLLSTEEIPKIERMCSSLLGISYEKLEGDKLVIESYLAHKFCAKLNKMLKTDGLMEVFENELSLLPIIAKMESVGVKIDVKYLENYEKELDARILELEKKAHGEAGSEFNLSSPKQLSEILFTKMKIKPIKKTKTGYSTDNEVLERLSKNGVFLAEILLEHRKLTKLNSTYVKALPKLCDENQRVHSTFNQEGAATGRFSSSNPNLQNIPSRTAEGRKIRKAFVAEEGNSLIIADYSQIELRILASLSKDENLLKAYQEGLDLHSITAATIFGKDIKDISRAEREKAKVINFSLIYGKSPFGLAKEIDISIHEAKEYIELYFNKYPKVKTFIKETIKGAREVGYVKTLFGRMRRLGGINSKNMIERNASERMAVNTVIQGTQAEIIKKAMVSLDRELEKEKEINLILQVHDELIFEAKDSKIEQYKNKITKIMEECTKLPEVEIKVNISNAKDWEAAK